MTLSSPCSAWTLATTGSTGLATPDAAHGLIARCARPATAALPRQLHEAGGAACRRRHVHCAATDAGIAADNRRRRRLDHDDASGLSLGAGGQDPAEAARHTGATGRRALAAVSTVSDGATSRRPGILLPGRSRRYRGRTSIDDATRRAYGVARRAGDNRPKNRVCGPDRNRKNR